MKTISISQTQNLTHVTVTKGHKSSTRRFPTDTIQSIAVSNQQRVTVVTKIGNVGMTTVVSVS